MSIPVFDSRTYAFVDPSLNKLRVALPSRVELSWTLDLSTFSVAYTSTLIIISGNEAADALANRVAGTLHQCLYMSWAALWNIKVCYKSVGIVLDEHRAHYKRSCWSEYDHDDSTRLKSIVCSLDAYLAAADEDKDIVFLWFCSFALCNVRVHTLIT